MDYVIIIIFKDGTMIIDNIKDKNYIFFKDNFKQITENHLDEYVVIYDR